MVVELIAKDKNKNFQYEGRCKLTIDAVSKLLLVEPISDEHKMISAMFKWGFMVSQNILFVFAEYGFEDFALIFDNTRKCNKTYNILVKKGATSGEKELIKERFFSSLNKTSNNEESCLKVKEIFSKWIKLFDGEEKEGFIQTSKDYNLTEQNQRRNHRKRSTQNRKHSTTEFDTRNEKSVVHLTQNRHILNRYKTLIEKPYFEVHSYENKRTVMKRLNIFVDSSRSNCYEFSWNYCSKIYYCCGCIREKHFVGAQIFQNGDGTQFVMLKSKEHICEIRKFDVNKYGKKEIIEADKFKIFKISRDGLDKSKLFIFTSIQKTACYEYYWENFSKKFLCRGCAHKRKHVSAEVFLRRDGSNYLKISKKKHVCELADYDPEKFDIQKNDIVKSSNFKVFKYKRKGTTTSKLIVFCPTNINLCYEYYWRKKNHLYFCTYCPLRNQVTANVVKNDNSSDHLMLSKTEHVCDLHEFDPDKYKDDVIVDKSL